MNVLDSAPTLRARYGAFASSGGRRQGCCSSVEGDSSLAISAGLYSATELAQVPAIALDLSCGCGNPTGFADLRAGEAVVDFGCGGGIDVILAAHRVGPQGRVSGIDFTPEMVERADEAVAEATLGDRVDVRVADMTDINLPDGSSDVVISNCVINLTPDKGAVFREVRRVLRPGGRLAVSDIVLVEPLPADVSERFGSASGGCLSAAVPEGEYLDLVRQAGLHDVQVVSRHVLGPQELEAMARCPGSDFTPAPQPEDLVRAHGKVRSIKFTAQG